MKKIEVLCATMHQYDLSIYERMNIKECDAIFANQADSFGYEESVKQHNLARMLTTCTIGVGVNRNFALSLARGDILLFADDDLHYVDNLATIVHDAFSELPDADMIVFGTNYAKNGQIYKRRLPKTEKLPFRRSLKYGTYSIAIRRNAVMRFNLHFSELFGGGCKYSYGEDSDFIVQCYRKGLSIYSYHAVIATTDKDTSTCFSGYGAKYYFDKGAFARSSLGFFAFPYMLRIAAKGTGTKLTYCQRLAYLCRGYRCFPDLISYDEWKSNQK